MAVTSSGQIVPSVPAGGSAVSQKSPSSLQDDLARRVTAFFAVPNNLFYCLLAHAFLCNGLVLAALGPSLLSLKEQTNSTLASIVRNT